MVERTGSARGKGRPPPETPLPAALRASLTRLLSDVDVQIAAAGVNSIEREAATAEALGVGVRTLARLRRAAAGQRVGARTHRQTNTVLEIARGRSVSPTRRGADGALRYQGPAPRPTALAKPAKITPEQRKLIARRMREVHDSPAVGPKPSARRLAIANALGLTLTQYGVLTDALNSGSATAEALTIASAAVSHIGLHPYREQTQAPSPDVSRRAPSRAGRDRSEPRIRCMHGLDPPGCAACAKWMTAWGVYVTTSSRNGAFHMTPDCSLLHRGQAAAATAGKDVFPIEFTHRTMAEADGYRPCSYCVPIDRPELLRGRNDLRPSSRPVARGKRRKR